MAIVVFNSGEFREIHPQFGDKITYSDTLLNAMFERSTLILNNKDCSKVKDVIERKQLLYLLTAHHLVLHQESNNGGGVISSATEGSVSVSFNTIGVSKNNAWYMKTSYGQEYWQLIAKYRTMHYYPNSSRPSWEGTNGYGYWW